MRQTKNSYSQPTDHLPGFQTYVKDPSPDTARDDGHEKQQVLPSPSNERSKPLPNMGIPQFGKPPGSDEALDGKSLTIDRARTKGVPGDDSPPANEPASSTPVRRPGLSAATKGPQFPGTHRQHEQGGKAKRYYQKYYRKNRNRIKNRSRRWQRKWKDQMSHKNDQKRREKYPSRFKRLEDNYRDPADRAKDWRNKQNKKATVENGMGVPVQYTPTGAEAYIVGLDDSSVTLHFVDTPVNDSKSFPLEVLFNNLGFHSDLDIDIVYDQLDRVFDRESEDKVAAMYVADFLYEKRPPNREPGQTFDRASPSHHMWPEHEPTPGLDTGTVWDNPGSAKVIPEGHDFENKADRYHKDASRIQEIMDRTDRTVHDSSLNVNPKLKRVDKDNRMWAFSVPGSKKGDVYTVRVKASAPADGVTDINKMDIKVSCSCPFWKWQGPEHWASRNEYLYGKPRGTASSPVVRDPNEKHWACKHVLSVLGKMKTFKIDTRNRLASSATVEPTRVAMRYIGWSED